MRRIHSPKTSFAYLLAHGYTNSSAPAKVTVPPAHNPHKTAINGDSSSISTIPKSPKDTVCDTPSIQSERRGQAIAAHGYPALCSFQRVIQYIGPPFRDREKDCRKPCEQGNKKEPHEQRLRENPNTCSHGPGSLSFGKPAPDHSLFTIQLWIVCWLWPPIFFAKKYFA